MVPMRLAVLAVLACAGCDVVFGLGGPSAAPDAGVVVGVDAGPQVVTGVITRRYVNNDATGAPGVQEVPFAGAPIDAYALADGTPLLVTWDDATGQFSFASPGGDYRVVQQVLGGTREVQGAAGQLVLDEALLGHPDDVAPPPGVSLTYALQPAALAGDADRVTTTGVWSNSTPVTVAPGVSRLGWEGVTWLSGQQAATVRPDAHDRVVFVRSRTIPATAGADDQHTAIVATSPQVIDGSISAGAVTPMAITLTDLSRDRCQYIDAPIGQALARMKAVLDGPAGWTDGTSAWVVYAIAHPELTYGAQFALAVRTIGRDLAPHTIRYGDAFPGSTPMMVVSANLRRQPAAGPPASAYLQLFRPADPTCAPAPTVIEDAPLPYHLELGGTGLDTDGLNIAVPAGGLDLTWRLDEPGTPATVHAVTLFRVDGADRTALRQLWSATPRVRIDPALLEDGVTYAFLVQSMTWMPGAPQGDFATRALTWARGYLDSPTFTAQR